MQRLFARSLRLITVGVRPEPLVYAGQRTALLRADREHAYDVERARGWFRSQLERLLAALQAKAAQDEHLERPGPHERPRLRRRERPAFDERAGQRRVHAVLERIRAEL